MPRLDSSFESAPESTVRAESANLEPGTYACRVQAVRTEWEDSRGNRCTSERKQYVKLILDIAEGPCALKFSEDYWTSLERDWGHTLYMSWSERALGMLKHTFAAFDEANPGFDSRAAFEADRWELFVGKALRVHWDGEEYEGNDGSVRLRVRPDRAVLSTETPAPKVRTEKGRVPYSEWAAARDAMPAQPDLYADVPF